MNQAYLKNILSAKFNFDIWNDLLEKIFPKVEIFTSAKKITDSHVKDGGHVGNIRLDDGRSLAIFRFEVADNVQISRNRKSLRDIAAKYVDQGLIHGALVFYYSQNQDDYRLTFIAKQTYFNENGEFVNKETAPKRYTFLLGKNEPCTTAASRLKELADKKNYASIYLTDVTDAFSVERLNKEFFNGYKAQYKKFVDTLSDTKQHRDYVKKLLGRLVFLQFLQKKGWMGVPVSNAKWEGGDKNYLNKLIDTNPNNNRLLSDVLEPLFFKTLNEKRNGDIADSKLGENIKIPYLNGGLFDKDKIDELDIDFPYSYFKELMDFFSQYNFTIDENDPNDSEVGIDPEMLGHIFENLLEDNKDKGAFYTPKEIVQYMCRQSVIQYLKTHEPSEQYAEPIEQLINDGVVSPIIQSKNIAIRFTQLLKEVKVCDPAIGSGAFPMGILYVLYHAIHHLHSYAEPHGNFDSTQTKRDIIQNNIFGVDIEQGAVDIARLRFWLALVVDADKPQPLPNLDYKITCGNSLLSRYPIDAPIENVFVEYNKGKKEDEKMSLAKYKELVSDYTNTSNHQTKELFRKTIEDIKCAFKTELSNQFKERLAKLRGKVIMLEGPTLFGERTKAEKVELKKLKKKLNTLEKEQEDIQTNKLYVDAFEWRFEFPQLLDDKGQFTGFDIVIGNPPYGVSIKGEYRKAVVDIHGNVPDYEIYYYFIERARNLICGHGILSYIIPNTWLFNTYAFNYRMQILENWNLIEVLDCTKFPIFESATVRNTIVTWRKKQSLESITVGYRNTARALNFRELISESRLYLEILDLLQLNQNWGLAFSKSQNVIQLIRKIKSNKHLLLEIFSDISQGLIAYDKYRGQSADIISSRAYHSFEYKPGLKKWLWGGDVRRYEVKWNNQEYIDYCDGIANPRQPKFFKDKRLLVREITNPSIYATITSEELYNDPAVLIILDSNNNYALEIVLAILNSKLATFYHFNHSPKATKGAFPKILVQDLKEFPLPSITSEEKLSITDLVKKILDSKKNNPQIDTSDLENQIDFLVYKLYGLTYDEVLIVDPETEISREEYEKECE
ncbi:MAG: TaqI-like C-terminal specificity domain-containing protein [Bacteroidales bacterium]|nr:TaqI-like C-terminal specificity domain-containing protein [Bacteroidales bacterium]